MHGIASRLAAVALLLSLFACKTGSKQPSMPTGDNSMTSVDWPGTYFASMPCADCEGIETTLTLRKDMTYSLVRQYQGKQAAPQYSNGTFKWNSAGSRITLSGESPADIQVGENQLFALDMNGNRITGALADKYVYKKLDMGITEKYWKLVELMGKPVTWIDGQGKEVHMILKADKLQVNAHGGCNGIGGSYQLYPMNRIRFGNLISTMMACPALETENGFKKALETADSYILDGDKLQLIRARMAPLARFEAVYMK